MSSVFDSIFFHSSVPYITPKTDLAGQDICLEADIGEICIAIFSFHLYSKTVDALKGREHPMDWPFNTTHLKVFSSQDATTKFSIHFPSYGASRIANSLEQLCALGVKKVYGIGLAGGVQDFLNINDIILLEGSIRGDGASRYYAPTEFPSVSDFSLFSKIKNKLDLEHEPFYTGLSFGTDALYRETISLIDHIKNLDALSIDLESSAFFTISRRLGIKACWTGIISDLLTEGVHQGIAHSEPVTDRLSLLMKYILEVVELDLHARLPQDS